MIEKPNHNQRLWRERKRESRREGRRQGREEERQRSGEEGRPAEGQLLSKNLCLSRITCEPQSQELQVLPFKEKAKQMNRNKTNIEEYSFCFMYLFSPEAGMRHFISPHLHVWSSTKLLTLATKLGTGLIGLLSLSIDCLKGGTFTRV